MDHYENEEFDKYKEHLHKVIATYGRNKKLDYRTVDCICALVKYIESRYPVYEPFGALWVFEILERLTTDPGVVNEFIDDTEEITNVKGANSLIDEELYYIIIGLMVRGWLKIK